MLQIKMSHLRSCLISFFYDKLPSLQAKKLYLIVKTPINALAFLPHFTSN